MLKSRKRGCQLASQVTWFLWRTPLGLVPSVEPARWKPAAINVSFRASEGEGNILKDVALNFLCCSQMIFLAFSTLKGKCQHSVLSNTHCRRLSWHPLKCVQRPHTSKRSALWWRHTIAVCCWNERLWSGCMTGNRVGKCWLQFHLSLPQQMGRTF